MGGVGDVRSHGAERSADWQAKNNQHPATFPKTAILAVPQCYLFHMYVGVRAGGGIGDEIEDPAGDPYEMYRIVFDITFFFFVIVILLAIIQGGLPLVRSTSRAYAWFSVLLACACEWRCTLVGLAYSAET